MPLQFVNAAAEICFYVFFALFLVSTAVRFAYCKENVVLSALFKGLPMLLWGAAVCALSPTTPVVYLSLFLFSLSGALFALQGRHWAFKAAATALGLIGTLLQLGMICSLFVQKVGVSPALFWLLLPVLAAAGGGAAGGFISQKKEIGQVVSGVLGVLYGAAVTLLLGFSAGLLSVMFLYSVLFVVLGALAVFLAGFVKRASRKFSKRRAEIYPIIPFSIGEVLLSLGLVLSAFAALI